MDLTSPIAVADIAPAQLVDAIRLGVPLDPLGFAWWEDIDTDTDTRINVDANSDSDADGDLGPTQLPTVLADDLRAAILNAEHADPRGLQLTGVRVIGNLDLDGISVGYPLGFYGVQFDADIWLERSQLVQLDIVASSINAILLRNATVQGSCSIRSCKVNSYVDLKSSALGSLDMRKTRIAYESEQSDADGRFEKIDLAGDIGRAHLGVVMNAASVRGDAQLEQMRIAGGISALGAEIGGYLSLTESKIGSTELVHDPVGCVAESVMMDAIKVGGVLNFGDAKLECSLVAHGARVGGQLKGENLIVSKFGSTTKCGIRLAGSRVSDRISLTGIQTPWIEMSNVECQDVGFDGAKFGWDDLQYSLSIQDAQCGEFQARDIEAIGFVDFTGSTFDNVHISSAQATEATVQRRGRKVARKSPPKTIGGIVGSRATIRKNLVLSTVRVREGGATFEAVRVDGDVSIGRDFYADLSRTSRALNLERARIRRLIVDIRAKWVGYISLKSADIDIFDCLDQRDSVPQEGGESSECVRVDLDGAIVQRLNATEVARWVVISGDTGEIGKLVLSPGAPSDGFAALEASSGVTVREISGWPVEGDMKDAIRWAAASPDAEQRVEKKQRRNAPGHWRLVANALDEGDKQRVARSVRISGADAELALNGKSWFQRSVVRPFLRLSIGHGYASERAIYWMAALWIATTFLVLVTSSMFVPTEWDVASGKPVTTGGSSVPEGYPALVAPLYALDVVVAPLGTGQSDAWQVGLAPWLSYVLTLIKCVSWALLGLFITGVTGLLGKK